MTGERPAAFPAAMSVVMAAGFAIGPAGGVEPSARMCLAASSARPAGHRVRRRRRDGAYWPADGRAARYGLVPGPRGRAGQSSQMSPVSVIAAGPCRVRSGLAVPVIVVILLSW